MAHEYRSAQEQRSSVQYRQEQELDSHLDHYLAVRSWHRYMDTILLLASHISKGNTELLLDQ